MRQPDAVFRGSEFPVAVGTAMGQKLAHRGQQIPVEVTGEAGDAAHLLYGRSAASFGRGCVVRERITPSTR